MNERDLTITRLIDAPREKVYRAWTEKEQLAQWWAPKPNTTPIVEMDVRPGGSFHTVMSSPLGEEYRTYGVYLELVPNEKIVFTDAYVDAWTPAADPFITVIVTFEEEGGKTRYTALVRHWNAEAAKRHVDMGFYDGWGTVTEQLAGLVEG